MLKTKNSGPYTLSPKISAVASLIFCLGTASVFSVREFALDQKLKADAFAQTSIIYNQDNISSPNAPDQQIIRLIENARTYVYFAVYTITKQNIADALIAAKLKGLDVKGLTDYHQSLLDQEKPILRKLQKYGIPIKTAFNAYGLMHMKMMVTDAAYASGSFNWTSSAVKYNEEVLEIGTSKSIHDQYLKIFHTVYKKYP